MARWRGAGGILQDSTVWGEIVARGLHVENSSWLFSLACHEVKHPSVSPLDTVHFTLLTAHCTLNTAHWKMHTVHCTLYTAHCTLHTAHCTLDTAHCTLHTAHCTLHTANCTLHTTHCTLHTAHCTLHPAHCRLHTAHCTLQTAHCTLHIAQTPKYFEICLTMTLYTINATNCEYNKMRTRFAKNIEDCFQCSTWHAEVPSNVIY